MAGDEDTGDGPPPRPSIPKRRREGTVIQATMSNARPSPRPRVALAAALVAATALTSAGVYWARTPPEAETADAARADAATALRRRFEAGEPLAEELARLARLGVDPAGLAPLRPFAATGAPSPSAIARAGLAELRKVGESPARDAGMAALERGDIAAALAALRPAPPGAEAWVGEAKARLAAEKAAQALSQRAAAGSGDARR